MGLQFHGGQLLFNGGQLAMDPACCCGFSSCAECIAGITSIDATVNGYSDGPGTWTNGLITVEVFWSRLNGAYRLLHDPPPGNRYRMYLGTAGDPDDRGMQILHQFLNADPTDFFGTYAYLVEANLGCALFQGVEQLEISSASFGLQCFSNTGQQVQCVDQTTCHSPVNLPMPAHQPNTALCALPWQQACSGVPITTCSWVHDDCPIPTADQNVAGTYVLNP